MKNCCRLLSRASARVRLRAFPRRGRGLSHDGGKLPSPKFFKKKLRVPTGGTRLRVAKR